MTSQARELVREHMPNFPVRRVGRIVTDTTDFMSVDYGDVVRVDGRDFLVMRHEAERKFGLEDPKFWVLRCKELGAGQSRILKLVFKESFQERLGPVKVTSYRSEDKEARILDKVRGDERFMQGVSAHDEAGNLVRILDIIRGRRLDEVVHRIEADHRTYFFEHFPQLLERFLAAAKAVGDLHRMGEKHGDVRSDHIWVESGTERWRWIDFDYTFDSHENPFGLDLFGLGNILVFLVGKAIHARSDLPALGIAEKTAQQLDPGDYSLVFTSRVVNLQKLYPYVPARLNNVLMRFSRSAEVFYERVDELVADLSPCLDELQNPPKT